MDAKELLLVDVAEQSVICVFVVTGCGGCANVTQLLLVVVTRSVSCVGITELLVAVTQCSVGCMVVIIEHISSVDVTE